MQVAVFGWSEVYQARPALFHWQHKMAAGN